MLHDVVLVWPRSRLTFTQHRCTRACALDPLAARQKPGSQKHRHVALEMLKMLFAFGQPVQPMSEHHATMLQDVALKCCERLATPVDKRHLKDPRTKLAQILFYSPEPRNRVCFELNFNISKVVQCFCLMTNISPNIKT